MAIKKVICPTDFSEASFNAIEYAAKLCQGLNAELRILNIQPVFPAVEAAYHAAGRATGTDEKAGVWSDVLEKTCTEINKMFSISCSYMIDATTSSLEKAIAKESDDSSLIVMGTNGIDDLYQYIFGTNTYQVLKKAQCPVWIVPEGVSFGTPQKAVVAWDPAPEKEFPFSQLISCLDACKAELIFLHIGNKEKGNSQVKAIKEKIPGARFEYMPEGDISQSIDIYMNESGADLLVLPVHKHEFPKNIFHRSASKTLVTTTVYPILVLHGN